ncbi:MAG: AAA family ATPase, partial [Candidatus Tectomicrobia bacterium]|nr:AAA family ATPase [Candidatus Tectomicrobia bacterium]
MLDPIRFQPEHLADLRKSGLSDETIEQSGLYSVRPSDVSKITAVSGVISLLAIPYGPTFTRYKVFPTNLKAKTKSGSLRYTQPGGSGVHLYIPPIIRSGLEDIAIPLGLVEGEKKALKACQDGIPCVAIGGLWNWLEDGRLVPDLKAIPLKGRVVILYPDSDVWKRQDLLEAVYRLGQALEGEDASVQVCAIPSGPGQTKQGLDDYLLNHQRHELEALPHISLLHKRFERARKKAQARENFGKPMARPQVVTMSDVVREPIRWLWWPYIAIAKICMLDGDPGIGKSLLMTQLAASLSRGLPLPDQQGQPRLKLPGPLTTLMLSTEDGLADTLKPRLEAAGADCSRIHVLTGWIGREDEWHAFTLQQLSVLETALQQHRPRLLIIDPIQAYLGDIDMHRANETRPLLAALARLAERYSCAIVCIRHPAKPGQGEGKAIHRGLGSIDFIGAARTALFCEQHPTDQDKALMAQSKSNIGRPGRTQMFSKSEGVFRWCGISRLTAELMAGSGHGPDRYAFLGVVCWLEGRLKPGIPEEAMKITEELQEDGYSNATIKRAKKALNITSTKGSQGWMWTLLPLPT